VEENLSPFETCRRILAAAFFLVGGSGCQLHHDALDEPKSGLSLALPKNWTQWDSKKLNSPEAAKVHMVGYAGDPDKKALVSLRRFSYQRLGARVAITGDTLDRLKPEDREKLVEVLVKQIERDLSEDNEYWQLESTRHSDSLKRGYFLELIGQVREAGETTRWLKYVLILPKKDEQIVEVRLSAPLIEKAKYQADLDLINDSLRRWING
jgi:hypothetical protein